MKNFVIRWKGHGNIDEVVKEWEMSFAQGDKFKGPMP
jgi:hypothetical protein